MNELSDGDLEVYARQIVLDSIGYEGQTRIRRGRVCIVGLGGLGTVSAARLTGMGVGFLRLVDMDVVSRSDLHRQNLYDVDSVGEVKVEAAAKRLCRVNPQVEIDPVAAPLTSHNFEEILKGVDVVVDGLDRIEPRYVLNRGCLKKGVPYVFGSALESYGNATTIIPEKTPCLECFYANLENDMLQKCAVVGVHPSIVGVVANLQVYDTVNILMGKPPLLSGKLFYADLNHMSFDLVEIHRNPRCRVCGVEGVKPPKPVPERLIEETCARDGKRSFIIRPKILSGVDLDAAKTRVEGRGWKVVSQSHFGFTFHLNPHVEASLLHTGVMILQASPKAEGVTEEYVKNLYEDLTEKTLA